jgi:hypothetical protein
MKLFDGNEEIELSRMEIMQLEDVRLAEIYCATEVYRSVLQKMMNQEEEQLGHLLEEVSESVDFLLKHLIERRGYDAAVEFAAEVSLMIILEENDETH